MVKTTVDGRVGDAASEIGAADRIQAILVDWLTLLIVKSHADMPLAKHGCRVTLLP